MLNLLENLTLLVFNYADYESDRFLLIQQAPLEQYPLYQIFSYLTCVQRTETERRKYSKFPGFRLWKTAYVFTVPVILHPQHHSIINMISNSIFFIKSTTLHQPVCIMLSTMICCPRQDTKSCHRELFLRNVYTMFPICNDTKEIRKQKLEQVVDSFTYSLGIDLIPSRSMREAIALNYTMYSRKIFKIFNTCYLLIPQNLLVA